VPVNQAVEEAHSRGVLTSASLMVGAPCADDAVQRSRRLPSLRVGLHLVLVEGRPVLPPGKIPDLVGRDGNFGSHLVRAGFRFFFLPGVRRQLESEIRAQFDAFRRTGLALDHANAHNHMHLHPTVLGLMLRVGREYGLKAVRLPNEPPLRSWRACGGSLAANAASRAFLSPWMALMKLLLGRAGIKHNDFVFGMSASGRMTLDTVERLIGNLPGGVTELYFHPASSRCPEIDRDMPDYRHEEEFRALVHPSLARAIAAAGLERIAFADI